MQIGLNRTDADKLIANYLVGVIRNKVTMLKLQLRYLEIKTRVSFHQNSSQYEGCNSRETFSNSD